MQEEKYREATANQNTWFSNKLDILFQVLRADPISLRMVKMFEKHFRCLTLQIYLCVLRDAAGVANDNLPETFSELHFTHGHLYCSRIDVLMEKYKRYYLKDDETDILDGSYEQQRKALMNAFDTKPEKNVLNAPKAFELLYAHRVDTFAQKVITFLHDVEEKVGG